MCRQIAKKAGDRRAMMKEAAQRQLETGWRSIEEVETWFQVPISSQMLVLAKSLLPSEHSHTVNRACNSGNQRLQNLCFLIPFTRALLKRPTTVIAPGSSTQRAKYSAPPSSSESPGIASIRAETAACSACSVSTVGIIREQMQPLTECLFL